MPLRRERRRDMTSAAVESSSVTSVGGSLARNIGGSPLAAPSLQPALQELRRQPLQVARDEREAVREEQHAEQHEQRARDAVHPHDVGAEALEPREKAVQGVGRDQERHGEPERIDAEQHDPLTDARLGGGEGEDRAEDRSYTGGPGRAEGDPHDSRAEIPERLAGELEAALPHQESRPQHAQQVEAEPDDQDAAHPPEPQLVLKEQPPKGGCRGAEGQEDEREPGDEPQRVQQRRAAPHPQLLQRQAGEEADVARDERQDAGRQKAQEPRSERQAEGDAAGGGRGDQPQKHTAETTVVQRPSSPHSAVEVTFIVRTISPESSHCSRRASQADPESNGTPNTVASIDAARSSAYSPAETSFWP